MKIYGNPIGEGKKLDFEFEIEYAEGVFVPFATVLEEKNKFKATFNPEMKQEKRSFDTITGAKDYVHAVYEKKKIGIDIINNNAAFQKKIVEAFIIARDRAKKEDAKMYVIMDVQDVHVCSLHQLEPYKELMQLGVTEIIYIANPILIKE